jgi:CrcB protein
MMATIWVGIGGAIGSIARYQIGLAIGRRWSQLPWGTFAVNVVGSLLLGVVVALASRERIDDTMRLALGTGVLGGFTTYSTFNSEVIGLAQAGAWGRAIAYAALTVFACLAAGVLGWAVAHRA